jgi:transcriptional regulator with XRE-family HTH domain
MPMSNKLNNKDIALKLKRYRLQRGWTLRQLAAVTKVSFGQLSMIENGICQPRELTVSKLSRALPDLEVKVALGHHGETHFHHNDSRDRKGKARID